ncbi:hypothetical protein EYZ11_009845 [Aspergillus tanneri]|uniref:Uncharacterized protein n=1 Tax=Aspergillus tanneri TaxID=1220188 RepID=A0A4S3J6V7_9EURO|nr:hypothetical protein EYZ11_009845 [Aspergillus tanneri]
MIVALGFAIIFAIFYLIYKLLATYISSKKSTYSSKIRDNLYGAIICVKFEI